MAGFQVHGAVLDTEFSDEGGHPVVQLHGLTSSRANDRLLDLDLGRGLHGTRLLRYDARGHGRSTGSNRPEDYKWAHLAEDLLALLDSYFPGEKVHGVGPSMGTGTMLHAAVLDPERFSSFTLMLPSTAWSTRPAKATEYLHSAALIENEGLQAFVSEGALKPKPPATVGTPAIRPDVSPALLPTIFRGAALADFPPQDAVARIDVPTSILAWIDDPGHPVSTAQALVELMPQATLAVAHAPTDVATWPARLMEDVIRADAATSA
ncbi:alpha/beta hydrolase [Galactobacter sp.]|uniref:alpha/beta fold hydrolase n=1 Tax=Galactobacter sp. TaxID=2676125 RepID=UPI0025B9B6DF|nr:alpha/beta hydrolase [Galactobacter sp.]